VENSQQKALVLATLCDVQIAPLLERSRQLVRQRGFSPAQAAQLAIDEYAELSEESLAEQNLAEQLELELTGFGVLQRYLDDPAIEEIWINRPNQIHYFSLAGHQVDQLELPQSAIENLVRRMLRHSRRKLDRLTPYVDADLLDGSRLHVVIPEITREHWAINIRKFSKDRLSLTDLVLREALTSQQSELLSRAVREGKSILVSGATQAGKTTMLTALLGELPESERVVSCEDTFELALSKDDWVAMQTRPVSAEGDFEIGLRELVRQALRMRPSRLVIGEVRGAEALDLLVALNSGIPGMGTIHARSAKGAIEKLLTLPLLAGENITDRFLRPTIASAINLVVHCERDVSGHRKVSEILEVTGEALA
jgi:pilus assembly protein CpaF